MLTCQLEAAGLEERVDHRSFKDRGIEQIPTEHLGPEASAMERQGKESRIGDDNRDITERNHEIQVLVDELAVINAEIAAEMEAQFLPAAEEEREQEPVAMLEKQANLEAPPPLTWQEQKAAAQSALREMGIEQEAIQVPQTEPSGLSWAEQREAAQSAFKELGLAALDAIPIDRVETSALSLEEQKRLAQSAFKEFERAFRAIENLVDQAGLSGLSWEERKTAAQSAFSEVDRAYQTATTQVGQAGAPALSREEQKRGAQSAFDDPIVKQYSEAIQRTGQIDEYGLGNSWYDRTVVFFENLYYDAMKQVKDTWNKYVGRYISPAQHREIELEEDR